MNLSAVTVFMLSALQHDPQAGWGLDVAGFQSIFWHDEMPDPEVLSCNRDDRFLIYSMFALRLEIWDGRAFTPEGQRLWDSVKAQVPDWPLFKRLSLTDEQKQAREEAETAVRDIYDMLDEDQA